MENNKNIHIGKKKIASYCISDYPLQSVSSVFRFLKVHTQTF